MSEIQSAEEVETSPSRFVRLLFLSAVLGVVIALSFEAFETASHDLRDLIWHDWGSTGNQDVKTLLIATVGGLLMGVVISVIPGRGGPHPGEEHDLIPHEPPSLSTAMGVLVVGFIALVVGASLGPEGALIPGAVAVSMFGARLAQLQDGYGQIVSGAGLGALLAAMFGNPLAGAIPLLEFAPVSGVRLTILILPALVSSSTAALTLQALGAEAAGALPIGFSGSLSGDILWAILVGVVAGYLGLSVDRVVAFMRRFTRRIDAKSVILTTTLGGFVLGLIYLVGPSSIRFTGIPELAFLVEDAETAWTAASATVLKVVATAWCLAAGYRGGRIFPLAFVGGAAGLLIHFLVPSSPIWVLVACGLAASMATGLGMPVTAGLIAAVIVGPELLPLALIAVVVAHTVHLLAAQIVSVRAGSEFEG